MRVIPALDLRDGKTVRLRQGNYEDQINYEVEPHAVIEAFVEAGAELIHVVDLDSARDGRRRHATLIAELAAIPGANIELGGGIRSQEDVEAALELGVTRVVLGTAAAEEPVRVAELASTFPGSIAIGVDVKDGIVATRGWEVGSGQTLRELLEHYRGSAIAAVIVTEISRDGMLSGPDPTPALEALDLTSAEVVVSGGVGTAVDIALLSDHRSQNGRTIDGVILGRALYEGSVNLREAIDAANAVTRP